MIKASGTSAEIVGSQPGKSEKNTNKKSRPRVRVSMGRPGARERVRVGTSAIHGRGVFACKRIREAAYIATFVGKPTRSNGMHVLWTLDEDGKEVAIDGQNDLRFLNHSHDPNVEFIGADLHAIANIQPGAELTFDYGDDWDEVD